jgi:uncharacterized protein (TIGR00299 family) protein
MIHLRLDLVGGVSGDMFVAAMADCFPEHRSRFLDFAKRLDIPGLEIGFRSEIRGGISGSSLTMSYGPCSLNTYPEFDYFISRQNVALGILNRARDILRRLAEAESAVHGCSLQDVHFHEIADWDTVLDCLLAAFWVETAEPITMSLGGDIPLGRGFVMTKHGKLPVPSPATAHLLKGFQFDSSNVSEEPVTPTGAAILSAFFSDRSEFKGALLAAGHGYGTRNQEDPSNFCRITAFSEKKVTDQRRGFVSETVVLITADIDDQTPEDIAIASDLLGGLEGVFSVTTWMGLGKKGRPTFRLEIICANVALNTVIDKVFCETATIGMRYHLVDRAILPRRQKSVEHDGSLYNVKVSTLPNGQEKTKIENDTLREVTGYTRRRRVRAAVENPDFDNHD